jgi:hypothetical protein
MPEHAYAYDRDALSDILFHLTPSHRRLHIDGRMLSLVNRHSLQRILGNRRTQIALAERYAQYPVSCPAIAPERSGAQVPQWGRHLV